jgi:hypothetical protein
MSPSSRARKPQKPKNWQVLGTDTEPNVTAVTAVRPVPVMYTKVPPPAGPLAGATKVTVGIGTPVYVKRSFVEMALVPSGLTTVTSTVPVGPAGAKTCR